MSHQGEEVAMLIDRWTDGDSGWGTLLITKTLQYEVGRRKVTHTITESEVVGFRLVIVNTPERGQPGYLAAKDFVNDTIPPGTWVQAVTHSETGSFGRTLTDLIVPDSEGTTISSLLLQNGLAVLWDKRLRALTP